MTQLEKFMEIFPNAERDSQGLPFVCPDHIGWKTVGCDQDDECWECWHMEVDE